jgi:hypothetical protein
VALVLRGYGYKNNEATKLSMNAMQDVHLQKKQMPNQELARYLMSRSAYGRSSKVLPDSSRGQPHGLAIFRTSRVD